jgi:hypothetical protein
MNPTNEQSSGSDLMNTARLDTFFPFDPLTLSSSSIFIEDLYVEWDGGSEISSKGEDDNDVDMDMFSTSLRTLSLEDRMILSV